MVRSTQYACTAGAQSAFHRATAKILAPRVSRSVTVLLGMGTLTYSGRSGVSGLMTAWKNAIPADMFHMRG
ncbi:hypothetical protein [Mycobacterium szulgai]|uniref:hypothetical protein n=1 Tax=Mycobacterium szulgai TaxID=1787 RepID=UPI00146F9FC9|nr:hypothetical protein [Mycobacterium szulgai]